MSRYIILQFTTCETEETILARRGWYEEDYQDFIFDDVGEQIDAFDSNDEAYFAWEQKYSKTEFFMYPDYSWQAYIYALCEEDYPLSDGIEPLEISCGNLTTKDIMDGVK